VNFSRFQAATDISRVNCVEITGADQDNLHTKFSALNVDYSSVIFDLLCSGRRPYECIKTDVPQTNKTKHQH